ncbi:MAG: DUF1461 domain-containing protein [Ardenticatenales bacterium]|nr:DUF1461 domain-containing protein [Ardenticatenales bacterium]
MTGTGANAAGASAPRRTVERSARPTPGSLNRWPLPVHAVLTVAVLVALVAVNVSFVCSPLYLRLAYGPLRPPGAPLAGPPDWVADAANATAGYVAARRGRDAVAMLVDAPSAVVSDRALADGVPTPALAERPPARVGSTDAGAATGIVPGRTLFDQAELDHLADVRRIIERLFALGIAALAVLALALAADAATGRRRTRAALVHGGQLAVGLTVIVGVLVAVAWDGLFTTFHVLLFPPGTWQFPSDSRLIQLFPDWFWQSAAAVLAGLLLAEGLVVRRVAGRPRAGRPRASR